MQMDLWRLDAKHELGGAFCLFKRTRNEIEAEEFLLRQAGWKCAIRPAREMPGNLVGRIWPAGDNGQLVELARGHQTESKAERKFTRRA